MRNFIFFTLAVFFGLISCTNPRDSRVKKIAENYFETFSQRSDSARLYSFYSDDFYYNNPIFEIETNNVRELPLIHYNWFSSDFKFGDPNQSIELESLTYNDSTIIGSGIMLPYQYKDKNIHAMQFIIQLDLDKDFRIKKQTDWYDYSMQEMIEAYQIKQNLQIR